MLFLIYFFFMSIAESVLLTFCAYHWLLNTGKCGVLFKYSVKSVRLSHRKIRSSRNCRTLTCVERQHGLLLSIKGNDTA